MPFYRCNNENIFLTFSLLGSDHEFYNDKPNFNDESEHNKGGDQDWHEGGDGDHQEFDGPNGEEHTHFQDDLGGEHPDGAEFHHDGGGDMEDNDRPPESYMGDRRGLGTATSISSNKSANNPPSSVSVLPQYDIYAALKKQEMAKTQSISQQQTSTKTMYESLKQEMSKEESTKPALPPLPDNTQNVNVYAQLKTQLKDESKMAVGEVATARLQTNEPSASANSDTKIDGNDDILQKPDNAKQVDSKLLKDFRQRFTEENGFKSVQNADEMLNELEELALTNQKQIDAHQINGDFYKTALLSGNKRQELPIASGSKRQYIAQANQSSPDMLNRGGSVKKYIRRRRRKRKSKINKNSLSPKVNNKPVAMNKSKIKTRKHKLKTLIISDGDRKKMVRFYTAPAMARTTVKLRQP